MCRKQEWIYDSQTICAPPGSFYVLVEAWGAGGGGSGFQIGSLFLSGGGGGAYAMTSFPIAPKQMIAVTIGEGGKGGKPFFHGLPGGDTVVSSGDIVITGGGGEAGGDKMDGPMKGGLPSFKGVDMTRSLGIRGSDAVIGEFSNSMTGGASPKGGSGGNSAYVVAGKIDNGTAIYAPGENGVLPGGGGGGATFQSPPIPFSTNTSGDGANGLVHLVWYCENK